MNVQEMREALRQMLADWEAAPPDQRESALAEAARCVTEIVDENEELKAYIARTDMEG